MKYIKFTPAEVSHILNIIDHNERDGIYSGNRDHYWKRSNRIKEKLNFPGGVEKTTCSNCGRDSIGKCPACD